MKTKRRKKKKRARLQPRFFIIIFIALIAGGIFQQIEIRNQDDTMTNFHGWLANEVEEYISRRENMAVIWEFEYSDTIEPTRIMGQSIQPGRIIGNEAVVVSVTVSRGQEVLE